VYDASDDVGLCPAGNPLGGRCANPTYYFLISTLVTPAEAGVQLVDLIVLMDIGGRHWIPAFTGMTAWVVLIHQFTTAEVDVYATPRPGEE
jgi:hypothetical protein